MRSRPKKISAFTLSEMIVVLLITTLVVGMAFSVLNLVQNQMTGIGENYERNTELNVLRQSLWIDFNSCDKVFYDQKNRELRFVNEMGNKVYDLQEHFITKDRDTFFLKWQDQRFLFKGREKNFGEIDALHLVTTKKFGNRPLFVFKTNASTTYMNQ